MEALANVQRDPAKHRLAMERTAAQFGLDVDAFLKQVSDEQAANGSMEQNWLPRFWRESRRLYQLSFGTGWWVDLSHTESLAAISTGIGVDGLPELFPSRLTLSEITSANRELTTTISGWLREIVTLDDESQPMGVVFPSKHGRSGNGAGQCFAYWMRRTDDGLDDEPATTDNGVSIELNDPALKKATELLSILVR